MERRNAFRLLVDIIIRPTKAFTYLRDATGHWWLVPLALSMLGLVLYIVVSAGPMARMTAEEMQEVLKQMPPEQAAQATQFIGRTSSVGFIIVTGLITSLLGLLIGWLLQSGVLHLVSLALGSRARFGQMFTMVTWASIPFFLRHLLQTAVVGITQEVIRYQGLASLVATGDPLKDAGNILIPILSRLDIFYIWNLVLLALGLAVMARFSRLKAALIILGYALLTMGISLGPVLITRRFMPLAPAP